MQLLQGLPLLLHCSLAGIRGQTEKSVEHEHTFLATCQNQIRNQDVYNYNTDVG